MLARPDRCLGLASSMLCDPFPEVSQAIVAHATGPGDNRPTRAGVGDLLAILRRGRLAEVSVLGPAFAQADIAEVDATATTYPSPKHLASWMADARQPVAVSSRSLSISMAAAHTMRIAT